MDQDYIVRDQNGAELGRITYDDQGYVVLLLPSNTPAIVVATDRGLVVRLKTD